MRKKLKPCFDAEEVKADLIDAVCSKYQNDVSVRALAKELEMSPMKVRKILITGGVYSTDLSTEIDALYKDGKTPAEIAGLLNTSVANVNSYLPYERIIYNMDEKSVEADRQQRYRDRKKAGMELEKKELPKIERVRNKTMIIVAGKKLRAALPKEIFDNTSDPLARDRSYTWASNIGGQFAMHEPADPDKSIWSAELTSAGRGKSRKQGVVLMSANCGFAVMSPLPAPPTLFTYTDEELRSMDWIERQTIEQENREKQEEYRGILEDTFIGAIRSGLLSFALPEERVLDYTDTIARIELVRGKRTMPSVRLEDFIERELQWEAGDDPVAQFNIRGNWTSRKFGNSGEYRHVEAHTCSMLGMDDKECQKWIFDFLAPMRETMKTGE